MQCTTPQSVVSQTPHPRTAPRAFWQTRRIKDTDFIADLARDPQLAARVDHDSYFNNKAKVDFESRLASVVFRHTAVFMPHVAATSHGLLPDVERAWAEAVSGDTHSIGHALQTALLCAWPVTHAYAEATGRAAAPSAAFRSWVCAMLRSNDPAEIFTQLAIQRAFACFLYRTAKASPELERMQASHWGTLDYAGLHAMLDRIQLPLSRATSRRKIDIRHRATGKEGQYLTRQLGTYAPGAPAPNLGAAPLHTRGMDLMRITTEAGTLAATGMHDHDLPQYCGPSGSVLRYVALGRYAGKLDQRALQTLHFFTSLYLVGMGAHSIDECFIIRNDLNLRYRRGDYNSILPPNYRTLWREQPGLVAELEAILAMRPVARCDLAQALTLPQRAFPDHRPLVRPVMQRAPSASE